MLQPCAALLTIELSPLTLTFPSRLTVYLFAAHTRRPAAQNLALDAPVIADTVIALVRVKDM